MAKGIEIGIGSETKAFKQGIESGVIDPIEDAVDALEDLGRSKGPDKLEDGFESAQKASKDLKKEVAQTADNIDRDFKQSYAKMKNSSQQGTSAAKRDLQELGNEAKQNAAETFSSFDGSAESFADGIQGTLGGIVSSLGPIGAAAGAAAAIGVGLAMAGMEDAKEEAEELKERVAELGQEYIETGGIGETSMDYIIEKTKELATETEEGTESLADLARVAEKTGVPLSEIAKIYAGNTEGLEDFSKVVDDAIESQQNLIDVQGEGATGALEQLELYKNVADSIDEVAKSSEEAKLAEAAWLESGGPELEAKAERISTIDDAYDKAVGSVLDYVNSETGILDVTAYLAAMDARKESLRTYQEDLANAEFTPEQAGALNDMGIEASAAFLAGYKSAAPADQARLKATLTEAGRDNSGEYNRSAQQALDAAAPLKVKKIEADVPNMGPVLNGIQSQLNNRKLTVKVKTVDQYGRNLF